ncbi:MAG: serine/threonine-protein kinase [Cyanobacteria bacterium J06621_8]
MEVLYQPEEVIQNRYRIEGVLGQGGTAVTYEAVDLTQPELSVAIKVLSLQQTSDWKLVELFEREVKVLKNLDHPRIPKYLDYFSVDTERDRQFMLVQELVPGKSLGDLVEQGWYFQEPEVKNIAQQVLEILTYLHGFQPPVIHRDIKPHNIIRTDAGEIYLVDLGAVQDVYRNTLTRGATFVGTIDYMSPEQLRGHASFASDLYSLGCTLLYLLTRRSPAELPLTRMKINFRSYLKIEPQFADWLDTILEPALEDRFSSTNEALAKLNSKIIANIKPPAGSNIIVCQNSTSLSFIIPPNKYMDKKLCLNYLLAMSGSTALIFFNRNAEDFEYFGLIWFFNTVLLTVILGSPIIYPLIIKIKIDIQRDKFVIHHDYKVFQKTQKGSTRNITRVTIGQNINHKSGNVVGEYCSIESGVQSYKFGEHLSLPERRWLVQEIRNFVREIDPYKTLR